MASEKISQGLGVVLAVTIVGLLVATLMPVAIAQFNGTQSATFDQTEGETVQITADLNGTLDAVDDATNTINVTVYNDDGTASVKDLSEGSNTTLDVAGTNVTVYNQNVTSATNATVEYEYPNTYGWDSGTVALFTVIPLLLVLAIFLFVAMFAVRAYKQA